MIQVEISIDNHLIQRISQAIMLEMVGSPHTEQIWHVRPPVMLIMQLMKQKMRSPVGLFKQ